MTSEVRGRIQGLPSQSLQTARFAIMKLRTYLLTLFNIFMKNKIISFFAW